MAVIQSQISSGLLNVDTTSNAARVNTYGSGGFTSPNIGSSTYSVSSSTFTPAASPNNFFIISGSSQKKVCVQKMWISSTQTTAGSNFISIVFNSAPNVGGTSAYLTIPSLDSNNPSPTAVVQQYTAAPSLGGQSAGTLWSGYLNSPAPATAGIGELQGTIIDFVSLYGRPITLISTQQQLAFNLNTRPTGMSVLCGVQWIEE